MLESILHTIKKMMGIPPQDEAFDAELLVFINSAISTLHQIGVGPAESVVVVDKETEWTALVADEIILSMAQSYIYLSVRLVFDPPGTSFIIEALKEQMKELAWRLEIQANPAPEIVEVIIVEEE